ncbi:MAG: 50S ribosomal protein L15 [Verrucomicrobiota bacterium]|jgi:large subunit ribosomal protein L15|uniref:50S ribosomal protein L15 n=1 Tax=Prosthecobacter sp. TaxID=1965333 RepID=UPI0031C83821|nr:50S ribosomal protein L15 [Verrucomicrobiaceae bacterium]MDH4455689.1 50S ribosomal protein L15 [Verrucomicrobiota bacterium]
MRLQDVKPRPGAKKRRKRIGCGESSGHGKTSGKGNKGQMARAGRGIRPGFEGGQMPMHRRLPKKGFNNTAFQDFIEVVNVGELNEAFQDGAVINEAALREVGLVSRKADVIKILGTGDLTVKLTIQGAKVSATAREKIEKAGGSIAA